uniref:Tr-type G domain-containing protein n=1 Tax=Chromera velia CCMP2878 TaxID=1169474 RepID=A0A0K6S985_9ALVE|mmetsp:Transcript_25832/g.50605  ORF Transcript_25832/g.50605 Transcript_25832/m.50605 type:complete len:536 (+) Transcript_25832:180-1787(+)|eukprot:Cvel_29003.t2-p1 / transcript=Cvel_29003.t2 / gene=Cvel_29003 / organism=Chromera_velia_CCMP2878 / gene_product=Eukaryotic peptide chain release factor GTP-binding, putative / transcript_product=Eukaryotic peptide chain release factor GTP-binding, putative / location=Cvel_scaffold3904:3785-9956(+) / protein_length=535 / sequence_SO=supercontig / SO=protein_coding / is_pseudo=false
MSADDGVPPPAPDYPQQQEEAQAPAWDAEAPAENGEAPPNGTVGNGDDAAADEEEEPLEDEGEEEEGEEEAGPARPKPKKLNAKDQLPEPDSRPHLNIVFIGHVDAGKSTTCGNILVLSGQVDQRAMEKYEREAKEKNRESWFLAYIMDTNEEERAKGKTVEVGRAHFTTQTKRYTILDAPGHKSFVPNMIAGASQADIAVLIISARKNEFEAGFERGGQTREHAVLAKTLGVSQLIVAINKMDDPSVEWRKERYDEIETKLTPYLKQCGYNPKSDIFFLPLSGLQGSNLMEHVSDPSSKIFDKRAAWYPKEKPTLFGLLDSHVQPPPRCESSAVRVSILDGYKDQGVVAMGKVEAGVVESGGQYILMPNKQKVKVVAVGIDDGEGENEYKFAKVGENVQLRVTGAEEEQVQKGFILCGLNDLCPVVTYFKAQVVIVELLPNRPVITAGYSCVLHIHTACEEVEITKLLEMTDRATRKNVKHPPFIKSNCMMQCVMKLASPQCLETYEKRPQLGRFTLRDEGKTIAIGKVIAVKE